MRPVALRPVALLVLLLVPLAGRAADEPRSVEDPRLPADAEPFEFTDYDQVDGLFHRIEYTPDSWAEGLRRVPRVFLANVPERWRNRVSKEITTADKKRVFFRILAPLVLLANEGIRADRERLLALQGSRGTLAEGDAAWLRRLAEGYGVAPPDGALTPEALEELVRRVDEIPVSLALAQGAEESGWGTSRFTDEGNALFGQWTWGDHAMKPTEQRSGMGNYGIASFETPFGSVAGYVRNLNTHRAYETLRERRAQLRAAGEAITGHELAKTLVSYSERGQEYVDSLHAIIRVNGLAPTDETFLGPPPAILLVPVGAGAE